MFRKRRRWLALGATAVILLLVWVWTPWAKYRYHGDGTFTDSGFFSYPRHEARFARISLSKVGEYRYHFQGLPNEEMTLLLAMDGDVAYDSKQWHELTTLRTAIEAVFKDSRGREVCRASGTLGNGVWVLTLGRRTAFWHLQCTHVRVHPNESYELTIRLTQIDPQGERIMVTPTLVGGGLEPP